jgi:hypothetical protein
MVGLWVWIRLVRAVVREKVSYGPPWAHYSGGYQDRLLGGPLGLLDLHYTAPDGVKHRTTEEKYSDRKLYKSRTV